MDEKQTIIQNDFLQKLYSKLTESISTCMASNSSYEGFCQLKVFDPYDGTAINTMVGVNDYSMIMDYAIVLSDLNSRMCILGFAASQFIQDESMTMFQSLLDGARSSFRNLKLFLQAANRPDIEFCLLQSNIMSTRKAKEIYKYFLTQAGHQLKDGHQFLTYNERDIIGIYLQELQNAFKQEIINQETYVYLEMLINKVYITSCNESSDNLYAGSGDDQFISMDLTLSHQLLCEGETIVAGHLKLLCDQHEQGTISYNQYKKSLLQPGSLGFNHILHSSLMSNQEENIVLCLEIIYSAFEQDILDEAEYKSLLLASDQNGYTPLHSALRRGCQRNIELYLNGLKKAVEKKIISKEEYKHLLLETNNGFTSLEQAVNSDDAETLKYFCKFLACQLTTDEVMYVLNTSFSTCDTSKRFVQEIIKDYLNNLHQTYILLSTNTNSLEGILTSNQETGLKQKLEQLSSMTAIGEITSVGYKSRLKALLINLDNSGFTPLQHILTDCQAEDVEFYLNTTYQAYKDELISLREYRGILIGTNSAGFNPLHSALKSKQNSNVKMYLTKIADALKEGILKPEDYRILLLAPNHAGFTPLQSALRSGKREILETYLHEINQGFAKRVITKDDYRDLLVSHNKINFTPLHQAAKNVDLQTLKDFVENVLQVHLTDDEIWYDLNNIPGVGLDNGILLPLNSNKTPANIAKFNYDYLNDLHKEYSRLLSTKDKDGEASVTLNQETNLVQQLKQLSSMRKSGVITSIDYKVHLKPLLINLNSNNGLTTLQCILSDSNVEGLDFYLNTVSKAFKDGFINSREYRYILIGSNSAGFNPLHSALISNQSKKVELYLQKVTEAFTEGLVNSRDYIKLLTQSNRDGFTPLHSALMLPQNESLNIYLRTIIALRVRMPNIFSEEILESLLMQSNQAQFTPLQQVLTAGDAESLRLYLKTFQDAVESKIITTDKYRELLTKANFAGFTPLHSVFISKKKEKLENYLTALREGVALGAIDKDEYKLLLLKDNNAGFTPLQSALEAGHEENIQRYLDVIEEEFQKRLINGLEYKDLLKKRNNAGFTTLAQAASNCSFKTVKNFFENVLARKLNPAEITEILNDQHFVTILARFSVNQNKRSIKNYLENLCKIYTEGSKSGRDVISSYDLKQYNLFRQIKSSSSSASEQQKSTSISSTKMKPKLK